LIRAIPAAAENPVNQTGYPITLAKSFESIRL
jgi:hypothetical protein